MSKVLIGSARSSYGNTKAGDQSGGKEVSTQEWYKHSKGWVVIRAKDAAAREKIAVAMERACANNDIGYSQGTRNTLRENIASKGYDPAKTSKRVNCDCSSLVRVCVNYAGISVKDFTTPTETSRLMATGAFEKFTDDAHCKSSDHLLRGDILNTRTKGHTVVVLTNGAKAEVEIIPEEYVLGERILKNGMYGEDVRELQTALIQLDYSCGRWGVDGEYGDETEMAVVDFQRDHLLDADGQYGPLTHRILMEELERLVERDDPTCVRIEGGNCYVRTLPNASAAKLGVAYKDEVLPFAGEISADGWLKISYAGADGWVSGKYGKLVG